MSLTVLSTLQDILVKDYKVARESLHPQSELSALGVDSLGLLELMFKIEDHYHVKIPGDPPSDLVTVRDVCTYIESLVQAHPSAGAAPLTPGMKS